VRSVTVDGGELKGNLVPVFNDGRTHRVEAVIG
jgi:cellobiose phosphorylase